MTRPRAALARGAGAAALLLYLVTGAAASPAAYGQTASGPDVDLQVGGPERVQKGQRFWYTVTYGSKGPGGATGGKITIRLGKGLRPYSTWSSPNPSFCSESGGVVTCEVGTLGQNARGIFSLGVHASEVGTATTAAELTINESDPNPGDNARTVVTEVVTPYETDLRVEASSGQQDPLYVGELTFYAVGVYNAGPADATGVVLSLTFPDGLAVEPGHLSWCGAARSAGGTTYACRWGRDAWAGTGEVLLVGVRATAAGTHTASFSVAADLRDPVPSDNAASVNRTFVPTADVSVAQAESGDPVLPGQPLTYTLTVANAGPSPATSVGVVDSWSTDVPGGAVLQAVAATQGSCGRASESSVSCALGTLAAGASARVTVTLQPRGPGSVTNVATAGAVEHDRDAGNNRTSESTTVGPG